MIYYYKVTDLKGNLIGIVNSYALRYYSERNHRMLCCDESLAQYICVNDSFYRVQMFYDESPSMIGIYPEAYVELTTKEEYEKYRESLETKSLE